MDKIQKQNQVDFITETFEKAKAVIFADYRGLNVEKMTSLRRKLGEAHSSVKIVKNRLTKRAAGKLSIDGFDAFLKGPTAMIYSDSDPVGPAKVVMSFAKDNEVFQVKAGYMEGKVLDLKMISRLASMPSREVLLSRMLGSINAPATNFVGVLAALPRQLVTVLERIKETKN